MLPKKAQWRWRRTLRPLPELPPELLGLVALGVLVLELFDELPEEELPELRRALTPDERRVAVRRAERTFLPCAAKESAATCASESARSLA